MIRMGPLFEGLSLAQDLPSHFWTVSTGPLKILVVDDEPSVAQTVALLLKHLGHNAEVATCVRKALELFESATFDLVITDYFMPGMHGRQLADHIRSKAPRQPIFLLTAYPERFAQASAALGGIDRVIGKPPHLEEMREMLAELQSPFVLAR